MNVLDHDNLNRAVYFSKVKCPVGFFENNGNRKELPNNKALASVEDVMCISTKVLFSHGKQSEVK